MTHLNVHKETVHEGIRRYVCDICNGRFGHYSSIKRHMVMHTGQSRFSCDQCDKPYSRLDRLRVHKRSVHDGIRPFVRDICDKRFARYSKIKWHMQLHTKERQFQCDHCDNSFTIQR